MIAHIMASRTKSGYREQSPAPPNFRNRKAREGKTERGKKDDGIDSGEPRTIEYLRS